MKVKNFAFFGVMAAIFATANANAEGQKRIASTNYVDAKIVNDSTNQGVISSSSTTTAPSEKTVYDAIQNAQSAATGAIHDAQLTVTQNGVSAGTFTANANSAASIAIAAPDWAQSNAEAANYIQNKPTALTDFTNDAGFITSADVPTNVSSFTNDANYITASDVQGAQAQADWDQTNSAAADFIKNKPAINNAQLTVTQNGVSAGTFTANANSAASVAIAAPDWAQSNAEAANYIQNKPTLGTAAAQNVASSIASDATGLATASQVYDAMQSAETYADTYFAERDLNNINSDGIAKIESYSVQTVKVNNTALQEDANGAVNVTVATGTTAGTIAVNGTDVAVNGVLTDASQFDSAGSAEAAESAANRYTDAAIQNAVADIEYPDINIGTAGAALNDIETDAATTCSSAYPCVLTYTGTTGSGENAVNHYMWTHIEAL